jgi:hypothetical protein
MLCIAAKAQPAGYVTVNGNAIDLPTLARMCGCSADEVESLIGELERNGVFSRDRHGRIYSRRIIRDAQRSATNQKNGRKGGNPSLCSSEQKSQSVKPPDKPPDKPHIPDTRIQKLKEKEDSRAVAGATRPANDETFVRFWKVYPRRDGANPKAPALNKFNAKVKSGADPEAIIAGAERYAAECRTKSIAGTSYVAQAMTWLNQNRWQDYAAVDPPEPPPRAITHGCKLAGKVFVKSDTPEWNAWCSHLRKTPPPSHSGGWMFPTLWPPGHEPHVNGAAA